MCDDMLSCLLMISINPPVPGTEADEKFLEKVLTKFEEKEHYKVPGWVRGNVTKTVILLDIVHRTLNCKHVDLSRISFRHQC